MDFRIVMRVGAAFASAISAAAAVVTDNPSLISAVLPPHVAASVTVAALICAAVLHEIAHSSAPSSATAPADPAPAKESP